MTDLFSYSIERSQAGLAELGVQIEQLLEEREIPAKVAFAVQLVIDELVSNIVKYGRGAPRDSKVGIVLRMSTEAIVIEIEDEGDQFDPFDRPAPELNLELEDMSVGGLGIHLTREVMDDCAFTYIDGRNRTVLRKGFALDASK